MGPRQYPLSLQATLARVWLTVCANLIYHTYTCRLTSTALHQKVFPVLEATNCFSSDQLYCILVHILLILRLARLRLLVFSLLSLRLSRLRIRLTRPDSTGLYTKTGTDV
jgi:hypothetical protein